MTPRSRRDRAEIVLTHARRSQVAAAVESKLFDHGRRLLRLWKAQHESKFGAGSWEGPEPSALGMHQLGNNTVIMSDTCNAARAAKTLLVDKIAEAVEAHAGPTKWAAMSEGERATAKRALSGSCFQHLRNIFLNAMAGAANTHMKARPAHPHEMYLDREITPRLHRDTRYVITPVARRA